MAKRSVITEKTEAGFRLVVIDSGFRLKTQNLSFRVTSLRKVPDRYFNERDAAEAAFGEEVAASLKDPRLGPIIN